MGASRQCGFTAFLFASLYIQQRLNDMPDLRDARIEIQASPIFNMQPIKMPETCALPPTPAVLRSAP
jgi:hypothetical protein